MRSHPVRQLRVLRRCREKGQALVYGLFALTAGLAALFFMFQTGQLSVEKTKLVNTADAVAYSAGIMHARALNFDAYTNRALIANEVMIAQLVSMASWAEYTETHARNVPPLACVSNRPVPVALGLFVYEVACAAITPPMVQSGIRLANTAIQGVAQAMTVATEAAKAQLVIAQNRMLASLRQDRDNVLQRVADANYAGDGTVQVDSRKLVDDFFLFEGGAPVLEPYVGDRRARMRDVAVAAAYRDRFVERRSWTDTPLIPCIAGPSVQFLRRGGTEMIGLDEWKAVDTGSLHARDFSWKLFGSKCVDDEIPMGEAARAAANGSPNDDGASYGGANENPDAKAQADNNIRRYGYSGIPVIYELRQAALDYGPDNADAGRRDLRLRFTVRLTRARAQTRTADGRSAIKPTGALDGFRGREAGDVLAAVATSEVFFERPDRTGRPEELASLFNPFWRVRLGPTPAAALAAAQTLRGPQ
jgi:hypothetical protein